MERKEHVERQLELRGGIPLSLYNQNDVVSQLEVASKRASHGDIDGISTINQPALFYHDRSLLVMKRKQAAAKRIQDLIHLREVFPNSAEKITSQIENIYRLSDRIYGNELREEIPEAQPQFRPSYDERNAIDFALNSGIPDVLDEVNFRALGGLEPENIDLLQKRAEYVSNNLEKDFGENNNKSTGFKTE